MWYSRNHIICLLVVRNIDVMVTLSLMALTSWNVTVAFMFSGQKQLKIENSGNIAFQIQKTNNIFYVFLDLCSVKFRKQRFWHF